MKKRLTALLIFFAMACTALAGCAPTEENKSETEGSSSYTVSEDSLLYSSGDKENTSSALEAGLYPGTPDEDMITVNIQQEPLIMNSLISADAVSFMMMKNIYENLVRLDNDDNVTPGAAESWDISADECTYTFHLREGMIWENGDIVTARDFEFAWKQLLNPETDARYAYLLHGVEGAKEYTRGIGKREDVKITAEDDLTLKVVLLRPIKYFLKQTASGPLSPINQRFYYEVGADKYGTEADYILSNGPFSVKSWVHSSEIRLTKNEDYFNADAVKIPKIKCLMITDGNAVVNSFMANELDMSILAQGSKADLLENTGHEVLHYDGGFILLRMNLENEVLSNLNVRKAITTAIDRQAFVDTVLQNSSLPAISLAPLGIKRKNSLRPAGDTQEAKRLLEQGLEELGMTAQEAGESLTFIADEGGEAVKMALFFKEQLSSRLGLDVEVQSIPLKSRIDRVAKMDYSLALDTWVLDYDAFFDLFVTGGGDSCTGFSNEEYDRLAAEAAFEKDVDKRMEIFYRLEEILEENAVIAPVCHRVCDYIVSDKVEGIYTTAFQDIIFMDAYIIMTAM